MALGACGGNGEPAPPPPDAPVPGGGPPGVEGPPPSGEAPPGGEEDEPGEGQRGPGEDPEAQPGGAGDEEPIRSEALLTGRDGRVAPRVVRVPPFIAVRVVLRSGDGAVYSVTVDGRTLRAAGSRSGSVTLEGLTPGERYPVGVRGGRGCVIEASAEPGP